MILSTQPFKAKTVDVRSNTRNELQLFGELTTASEALILGVNLCYKLVHGRVPKF